MQANFFSIKMVIIEQFCTLEKDYIFVSTMIELRNPTPKNPTA